MTARGLVFRNRMISTAPTNAKIYHRCIALVAELAAVPPARATAALLRAIYGCDELPAALFFAPIRDHIEAATPRGAGRLRQQLVMPLALVLAHSPSGTSVVEARAMLAEEPRVNALLRRLAGNNTVAPSALAATSTTAALIAARAIARGGGGNTLALGLDLGTTSIKAAVVDLAAGVVVGEVLRSPLGSRDFRSVVLGMCALARRCAAAAQVEWRDLGAVGVSQPGHIDLDTGRVEAAANLPWQDAPLREELSTRLGVPVVLVEDGDAALFAELAPKGAAAPPAAMNAAQRSAHTAVLIVVGGGVGTSIAVGGVLLRGERNMIEGGHMIVEPSGRACGCGQRGCVEAYVYLILPLHLCESC